MGTNERIKVMHAGKQSAALRRALSLAERAYVEGLNHGLADGHNRRNADRDFTQTETYRQICDEVAA